MSEQPTHQFTSHIDGKNAKVSIYPDRVEWDQPRSVSKGKMWGAALTGGLSLAATGVKSNKTGGSVMIPVRSITSVSVKRDGMMNSIVLVQSAGGEAAFRVSHAEGKIVKETLLSLVNQAHDPRPTAIHAPAPIAVELSAADKIQQLATLYAQGVLTDEEFSAGKAKALGL